MKIAVVGPSPIPYTIGGAENLMWGLCDAINQYTEHQAELIKVPVNEIGFWNLIDSYYRFFKLDLSHFDLIITTKYPSWMVAHRNSICYMLHTLRGFYDTYHMMNLPEEVESGCGPIDEILGFMEKNRDYDALDDFFDKIYALRNNPDIPEKYYNFPGPFIRLITHYMDYCALTQDGVVKHCAISDTVKNRKDYFPDSGKVQTIYPPTTLKNCTCGNYEYIFMVSRLDAPKRIDMLIRAMKHVKSNVKLLIAGTGPEREKLEALAGKDPRVEFLGFVTDSKVEELYANCLAVPYFPYDEDYGYITIETMLHKKPVITTVDSGGPNEFVEDGVNGFIVNFDEKEIAEKIDYLVKNSGKAKEMGENALKTVSGITWQSVVGELLDEKSCKIVPKRDKIAVTSTFSIYPPMGGGQARIYNLYKAVSSEYDVEVVAFDAPFAEKSSRTVAKGLKETKIPKSERHQQAEMEMTSSVQFTITDIAMITLSSLTPEYGIALRKAVEESKLVVISHPYLYNEAKKYLNGKSFIYEAHNVEFNMKKNMLPAGAASDKLLRDVYETEKECCVKSRFIMTCSDEDKDTLNRLYDVPKDKIIVVPNGVDCANTVFTPMEERRRNKSKSGLSNEHLGIFMGSWHKPNLDACEKIFEIAKQCPDTKFMLLGSQCAYFKNAKLPENVGLLGLVTEEEKNKIFATVDFALNPMMSGSGTNLKMFDYMSAGIPIITTPFGTRGIDNKDVFVVSEIDDFAKSINAIKTRECGEMVEKARKYVEDVFDWRVIAKTLLEKCREMVD